MAVDSDTVDIGGRAQRLDRDGVRHRTRTPHKNGAGCPSEHFALRGADINFETGTMASRVPKLEHKEGHATRVVPLLTESTSPGHRPLPRRSKKCSNQ